jgi:hypothetical protein
MKCCRSSFNFIDIDHCSIFLYYRLMKLSCSMLTLKNSSQVPLSMRTVASCNVWSFILLYGAKYFVWAASSWPSLICSLIYSWMKYRKKKISNTVFLSKEPCILASWCSYLEYREHMSPGAKTPCPCGEYLCWCHYLQAVSMYPSCSSKNV